MSIETILNYVSHITAIITNQTKLSLFFEITFFSPQTFCQSQALAGYHYYKVSIHCENWIYSYQNVYSDFTFLYKSQY